MINKRDLDNQGEILAVLRKQLNGLIEDVAKLLS